MSTIGSGRYVDGLKRYRFMPSRHLSGQAVLGEHNDYVIG